MHPSAMMLRDRSRNGARPIRSFGLGYVDENGNEIPEGNLAPMNLAPLSPSQVQTFEDAPPQVYSEPATYEEPAPIAPVESFASYEPSAAYDASAADTTTEEPMNFTSYSNGTELPQFADASSSFDASSFDLAALEQPAIESAALTAGGIDHFAEYTPPGGIHEAQVRLAAWGRPKAIPDNAGNYGYSGPLVPGDFGLSGADLDGADSPRVGMAIASFQRWANQYRGAGLPQTGLYTQATHAALVNETGGAIPTSFPPSGSNVIPFPGSATPGIPGSVPTGWAGPNSPPGTTTGSAPTKKPIPWLWIALAAAAGIVIVVFVARKRRRARK